jgi:hypothetical protein
MNRHCPDCGETLNIDARRCECGWKSSQTQQQTYDPRRHLCSDDYRGQRCSQPGTLSTSTMGGGPWFCHTHFPHFRGRYAHKPNHEKLNELRSMTKPLSPEPSINFGDVVERFMPGDAYEP